MRRPPIVTAPRLVFSSGLSSSDLASPGRASGLASSGLATAGVVGDGAARDRVGRAHATAARTVTDHASFCIAATLARPTGAVLYKLRQLRSGRAGATSRDNSARLGEHHRH